MNNDELGFLDVLALVSFAINFSNYGKNVTQNQMDERISEAVQKINSHLESQDKKIDEILRRLDNDS